MRHAATRRAHPREMAQAQRGMRDAARLGMKPVFLLAFLALGPALANLVPVAEPVVEAATTDAITGRTQHPAAATVPQAERAWLCGR